MTVAQEVGFRQGLLAKAMMSENQFILGKLDEMHREIEYFESKYKRC